MLPSNSQQALMPVLCLPLLQGPYHNCEWTCSKLCTCKMTAEPPLQ